MLSHVQLCCHLTESHRIPLTLEVSSSLTVFLCVESQILVFFYVSVLVWGAMNSAGGAVLASLWSCETILRQPLLTCLINIPHSLTYMD